MRTTFSCFQDTRSGHSFSTPLRLSRPALEKRGKASAAAYLASGTAPQGGVRPRESSASRQAGCRYTSIKNNKGAESPRNLPLRSGLCAPDVAGETWLASFKRFGFNQAMRSASGSPPSRARPNSSLKATRYGRQCLAASGTKVNFPYAASHRLPPRSP
jgi:hypothetical protein